MTTPAPTDLPEALARSVERDAFKAAHRHLELDEVPDGWGRPMFKHSHVEASWLGWSARANCGTAAQAGAESYPPMPDLVELGRDKHGGRIYGHTIAQLRAYADATAALRARGAVPSGWKLVPVEPTTEMLTALSQEWHKSRHRPDRYAAMLAAAPQPPAALPGEQDTVRLDFVLSELRRDGMDMLLSALHDEDGFPLDKTQSVIAIDAAMAAKGRTEGGAA